MAPFAGGAAHRLLPQNRAARTKPQRSFEGASALDSWLPGPKARNRPRYSGSPGKRRETQLPPACRSAARCAARTTGRSSRCSPGVIRSPTAEATGGRSQPVQQRLSGDMFLFAEAGGPVRGDAGIRDPHRRVLDDRRKEHESRPVLRETITNKRKESPAAAPQRPEWHFTVRQFPGLPSIPEHAATNFLDRWPGSRGPPGGRKRSGRNRRESGESGRASRTNPADAAPNKVTGRFAGARRQRRCKGRAPRIRKQGSA